MDCNITASEVSWILYAASIVSLNKQKTYSYQSRALTNVLIIHLTAYKRPQQKTIIKQKEALLSQRGCAMLHVCQ